MRLTKLVGTFVVALVLSGCAANAATGPSSHPAATTRLTELGSVRRSFEELLHETFGAHTVCILTSDRDAINFPQQNDDCAPLARYAPFDFLFRDEGTSPFHVSSIKFSDVRGWWVNAEPVLISGRLIGCTRSDSKVLIALNDYPAFGLDCITDPFTSPKIS